MIRLGAILLILAGPAVAVTPLPDTQDMAVRSGRVLGAAAACGVSRGRIAAVQRTTLQLIGQVSFDATDRREAEHRHNRAIRETQRQAPTNCAAAVAAFEQAERN